MIFFSITQFKGTSKYKCTKGSTSKMKTSSYSRYIPLKCQNVCIISTDHSDLAMQLIKSHI